MRSPHSIKINLSSRNAEQTSSKVFECKNSIGPSILDVAHSISDKLATEALGGLVNGNLEDLRYKLSNEDTVEVITRKHPRSLEVVRHSTAHVLAQAVQSLFDVQVTIGPVIDDGFYYDFYCKDFSFSQDDFPKIEKKMREIIKSDLPIEHSILSKSDALDKFKKMGETFKVELINDLDLEEVSIYSQGDWLDLCKGPHVQRTGQIKEFALLSTAGSYWRGDETRQSLQRIYGTAWNTKKELKDYLERRKEAKKRDHRVLGKQMKLFYFSHHSPGSPFFTPEGTIVYNELTSFIRDLYLKRGYLEVITPQIYDCEMYKTSGHYDNFAKDMFFINQDKEYALKPMNCPGHCLLYKMDQYSYRDLPLRIADFGRLHRFERSGVLHGMTRVRSMCQDDAHIFCTEDQLSGEITSFIEFLKEVYEKLGLFDIDVKVATRPKKRVGSDELWDISEKVLIDSLNDMGIKFSVESGEGAFYGPKMEFHITDAIGRSWQLGTLQLDYSMPSRFGLEYTDSSNKKCTPIMLHRAVLGTLERFMGVYIEHCAGHLPTWLSPTQVVIMNISESQMEYSKNLLDKLKGQGIRTRLDSRNETLGYKLRDAQMSKVPYFAIVGQKEVVDKKVAVRTSSTKESITMDVNEFVDNLKQEINNKNYRRFYQTGQRQIK